MEIWDGYKEDGSPAGCDLVRGEPIPAGLFHIVSEVLVKHTDGSYLLMQRDWNKIGYPGLFEAGASGSILKGENAYEGAIRELREETGIKTDELTHIFIINDLNNTIFYGYLCVTDCEKSGIVFQEGETISNLWLERDEFLSFMDSENFVQPQKNRWMQYFGKL
jgi:8-oxo-dGTP pyrophosphatase MutT (NUDIX family)